MRTHPGARISLAGCLALGTLLVGARFVRAAAPEMPPPSCPPDTVYQVGTAAVKLELVSVANDTTLNAGSVFTAGTQHYGDDPTADLKRMVVRIVREGSSSRP